MKNQHARIEDLEERALRAAVPNDDRACAMCGGIGDGAAIVLAAPDELAAWYALDGCPRCGRGRVLVPDHGRDPNVAAGVMARRTVAAPAPPPDAPDFAALTRMSDLGSASTTPAPAPSPTPVPSTGPLVTEPRPAPKPSPAIIAERHRVRLHRGGRIY